jgi:hypothetical protein
VGNRDDQGITSLVEIEKATENLTMGINWESGYSANYFAVRDSGFSEFWRLSTNLTYNYHDKLEFSCRGAYGYDEYTYGREGEGFASEAREDYRYNFNTQLTYYIVRNYLFLRELLLELEFHHVENDSSLDSDYYINNQFMARITATF